MRGWPEAEARRRFYAIDRDGLRVEGMPESYFQQPFAQSPAAVANWPHTRADTIGLADVVANAKPTVLIGVSGQPGIFGEDIIRQMAATVARPIVFPLSNPTSRSEATPQELTAWTEGRAVIGTEARSRRFCATGDPSLSTRQTMPMSFPALVSASWQKARRVTHGMLWPPPRSSPKSHRRRAMRTRPAAPVAQLREVAFAVAKGVAREARAEGQCEPFDEEELDGLIARKMWKPVYRPYRRSPHPALRCLKGREGDCGPGGDLLFRTLRCSTIGAEGFHGRVRDGIGCLAPRYGHQAGKPAPAEAGVCHVTREEVLVRPRAVAGSCRCTRAVLCWGFKRQSSD